MKKIDQLVDDTNIQQQLIGRTIIDAHILESRDSQDQLLTDPNIFLDDGSVLFFSHQESYDGDNHGIAIFKTRTRRDKTVNSTKRDIWKFVLIPCRIALICAELQIKIKHKDADEHKPLAPAWVRSAHVLVPQGNREMQILRKLLLDAKDNLDKQKSLVVQASYKRPDL